MLTSLKKASLIYLSSCILDCKVSRKSERFWTTDGFWHQSRQKAHHKQASPSHDVVGEVSAVHTFPWLCWRLSARRGLLQGVACSKQFSKFCCFLSVLYVIVMETVISLPQTPVVFLQLLQFDFKSVVCCLIMNWLAFLQTYHLRKNHFSNATETGLTELWQGLRLICLKKREGMLIWII